MTCLIWKSVCFAPSSFPVPSFLFAEMISDQTAAGGSSDQQQQQQQGYMTGYDQQAAQFQVHPHHQMIQQFWANQYAQIESEQDFKTHQLPLARVKKVMKTDEDVRNKMVG
jgi:hypothetical protein